MSNRLGIDALLKAIAVLGSQQAVASTIGVRQQAVSECVLRGRKVSAEWCGPIERATSAAGNTVFAHELRPDLYPPVNRDESPRLAHRDSGRAHPKSPDRQICRSKAGGSR